MGSLGVPELLIIFLVVLLVFGAKRIPEIARGLGKGIREFKDATTDIKRELNVDEPTTPPRRVEAPREAPLPRYDSPAQRHPVELQGQPFPGEPRPAEPLPAEPRTADAPPAPRAEEPRPPQG